MTDMYRYPSELLWINGGFYEFQAKSVADALKIAKARHPSHRVESHLQQKIGANWVFTANPAPAAR